jgi:Domain of unknown function DUF29
MTIHYQQDVVAWANEQAALLRAGQFTELDLEQIAEEIVDVGRSEQRELENRLRVLLMHLLKWRHQPERRSNSWRLTIKVQRKDISRLLDRNPSLKTQFEQLLIDAFEIARLEAAAETGLPEQDFSVTCPYSVTDVLESDL